uniref:Glycogen debrancher n=1 Tax=Angiostrongylus cantonensis TaxID=6313 RepID=A0A158PC84_ANGCA
LSVYRAILRKSFQEKPPKFRIIVLEEGENLDTVHSVIWEFIVSGNFVRFHRGASLLGKDVCVWTTLTGPQSLTWTSSADHLATYCELECTKAGSFKYHFNADGVNSGSGYFLVMPVLMVNGKRLPLDGIACQTHLTKLLGPLSSWEDRLRVSKESGYNMIHLTPIHHLGVSNSSYSISDHHALIQTVHEQDRGVDFVDIEHLVNKIEKDWNMLTVQDVVWNHAAKNAPWLQEHPECGYNCSNSPHLRPAFVLDRVYHHFGVEVGRNKWASRGVPDVVNSVHHTNTIEYILRTEVLPKVRLHEFFQVNIEENVGKFEDLARTSSEPLDEFLPIEQDPEWKRFGCSVDWAKAMRIFNRNRDDAESEEDRVSKCTAAFREHLTFLNNEAGKESWYILMAGLRAVMGHITYQRTADGGPKLGAVTEQHPLTTDYFSFHGDSISWEEDEKLAYNPDTSRLLHAFNGWVMSADPLKNFALPDSQVYLRRELVCWGDSIKLNYGEKLEDSPFLWEYMKSYTQKCAQMFHGLRIDNAHGTPIHVAEVVFEKRYCSREVKKKTTFSSIEFKNLVIKEAQAAHDSHEQGRLVYRYGGDVVGAMIQKPIRPAPACVAHALFLDQSHDNPTPIETRSVFDLLPTAAMVSMASCALGSTRGYDELVSHINVVSEKRLYAKWGSETNRKSGIIEARKILNDLHVALAKANYTQVFVDQMNPNIVGVTRHNPVTHDTVVVVSHTAFDKNQIHRDRVSLKRIPIGGELLNKILFEMRFDQESSESIPENNDVLLGLSNYAVHIRQHIAPDKSSMCVVHGNENGTIEITDFPSGSVIGFNTYSSEIALNLNSVSLQDYNRLLFICDPEGRTEMGQGSYEVPCHGKLVYCGLQGLIPLLNSIRTNNDLGHPLCANLRDGTWLCKYIFSRMAKYRGLQFLSSFFHAILTPLDDVPYYLRPCYFEAIITYIHKQCRLALLRKLSPTISSSSGLVRALALSSVSFVGHISGAALAPLPASIKLEDDNPSSLAAGLPHFTVGIWRNWGRDTFIALPGCLLSTGRFYDARLVYYYPTLNSTICFNFFLFFTFRNIIISYAGSLRHGLIPNLLAEGKGDISCGRLKQINMCICVHIHMCIWIYHLYHL